ncbi:winged helix-turn-helix domain-containing protein [Microbacterium aquimaris]|uniref:Winged helix-turn-helix domain-containing protein n=1 Tax=Microbacterium aquimaris TaxID=459816 RepID=A0ABU5N5H3_9MICO|nr:winged helix-turn-helix domain-containing protein [Microbacterium aquimaris]MDZ8161329.1 winged helix-turn-helix domain-containing protein [Microbacterium aquimaris]
MTLLAPPSSRAGDDPIAGAAKVVVLGRGPRLVRGTPAEYRRAGIAVHTRDEILPALTDLVHDRHAILVVAADFACDDFVGTLEVAVATGGAGVLLGMPVGAAPSLAAPALDAGVRGVVSLPLSPERLARELSALPIAADPLAAVRIGDLTVDAGRHRVELAGRTVEVTPREFDLLWDLVRCHPRVAPLGELAQAHAGGTADPFATVRVGVAGVRRRLEAAASRGSATIETVRGVGYRIAL